MNQALPAEREAQRRFHRRAAIERHLNRIENPYLRRKEDLLAEAVLAHTPAAAAQVLEVGCGEGSNLWFLARARSGWRLTGVDISHEKVGYARQMQPSLAVAAADALALPFSDGTFDTVICRDLLHHVNWDRDGVIREALRVVRPGGHVLVFEGRGTSVLNRLFAVIHPIERGMRDSTPGSITALLARHGTSQVRFVEVSSVVRAVGFVIGWPSGARRAVARVVYEGAVLWERAVAQVLPQRRWVYMLGVIQRAR